MQRQLTASIADAKSYGAIETAHTTSARLVSEALTASTATKKTCGEERQNRRKDQSQRRVMGDDALLYRNKRGNRQVKRTEYGLMHLPDFTRSGKANRVASLYENAEPIGKRNSTAPSAPTSIRDGKERKVARHGNT